MTLKPKLASKEIQGWNAIRKKTGREGPVDGD